MEVRLIPGRKPSALDASCEAARRRYGRAQADAFSLGVGIAAGTYPADWRPRGVRSRAWCEAGEQWAREEISRRAAADWECGR